MPGRGEGRCRQCQEQGDAEEHTAPRRLDRHDNHKRRQDRRRQPRPRTDPGCSLFVSQCGPRTGGRTSPAPAPFVITPTIRVITPRQASTGADPWYG